MVKNKVVYLVLQTEEGTDYCEGEHYYEVDSLTICTKMPDWI